MRYAFINCCNDNQRIFGEVKDVEIGKVYDLIDNTGTIYKCYRAIGIHDYEGPLPYYIILNTYEDCGQCSCGEGSIIIEDDVNIKLFREMNPNEPLLSISLDIAIQNGTSEHVIYSQHIPLNQNYVGGFLSVLQEDLMPWATHFPQNAVNNTYRIETTGNELDVKIPFLIDWKYFQSLPILYAIFGANATKNWLWYQQDGWSLKAVVKTQTDVGNYVDELDFDIRDYNDNPEVDWTWEFFRESTLEPITTILGNEKTIVKVIANMPNNTNKIIDWATVTVEGFESEPRWLISSFYESLGLENSPLKPLDLEDRLRLDNITMINARAELSFIFDPSKISAQKIKLTARIGQDLEDDYSERTVITLDLPIIPTQPLPAEFKGDCCDCLPELKLASKTSEELIHNDITGVAHKNLTDSDTCVFEISKNGEVLQNAGVDYPNGFPNDENVSAFIFNWKFYIINHGPGCYEIKKKYTIAGLEFEEILGKYDLKEYTPDNARRSVRVLYQNDFETLWDDSTINYSESGFEDSYRFRGMFGNWQPNVMTESDFSVLNKNRTSSIKSKDTYILNHFNATECHIKRLHKIVMHATVWRVSDHNPNNTLQENKIYECILDKDNTEEITYHVGSKITGIEVILSKRQQNSVSLFSGSLQLVQGATWMLPTVSGVGNDFVVTFNGGFEQEINDNRDFTIKDSCGKTLTIASVVGNVITIHGCIPDDGFNYGLNNGFE